jgi:hypothetical protein
MTTLKFSRFGKAPGHWYAALTVDKTGLYRLQPCPVGYEVTYVPMFDGGEIVSRRESLGLEGSFAYAKQTAQRHAEKQP